MSLKNPFRVAVYFAPAPESQAWTLGSTWLGRCSHQNRPLVQPIQEGISPEDFEHITREPRRYGWHATLKPPFQLAANCSLQELRANIASLASRRRAISLPTLDVGMLGDFLALRPSQRSAELDVFAAQCVMQLHRCAAPLNDTELARRRLANLSPEQDALLVRWGYPWVLEHFRFHFSLTGSLKDVSLKDRLSLEQAARQHFFPALSLTIDRLSLFVEPERGADFVLDYQWEFAR